MSWRPKRQKMTKTSVDYSNLSESKCILFLSYVVRAVPVDHRSFESSGPFC